ncbi:DEAD/DEAH box helicase [Extensimonas vulgaris]|uniref:DNA 3'-5' helicase n=1 Tax=Extensimonas vulgaris TaxID=1031594 RepID=A0A369AP95_9BURK|nr:3'-5' exonuclease [Extensimonas vulgaris]RCX09264.1 UvrD-like helicase family protein [Extensimonas vulgaris]TWI37847.1 UvrD-like helicase family protein [Extensimonas vulgaris]TXD15845.1 AAA family ATPase [Extensimonas vulgaris]
MALFPQGLTQIDKRCANAGERAVLHQLKRCLSDDYLVWHDVPIGPKARQPDFVVFSPRRGLLILEVKHWAWGSLRAYNRDSVELATARGLVTVAHPLLQARGYALELNEVLERDPALIQDAPPFRGKSRVPYGWGCVLSNVRRKQVEGTDFAEVFPDFKTLLRDDLSEELDPYEFEKRLWGMYAGWTPQALTLPQRDRVRWHLFPEVRVQQASLFEAQEQTAPTLALPDLMQVMDLQQEQVARTLGEGHRVIHGPAGSGKTMILIFRAQQLAAAAASERPILVLCFNRILAQRIEGSLRQRGVDERVQVRTFHGWCQDMVRTYQLDVPQHLAGDAYFAALAETVERAVARGLVPGGQYLALLIDEAHDFEDAWLRVAARMVDPATNALLVLYDDAQSIYQKKRRRFNFASVGIQAQGRTSILKLNYRNTAEVLALAMHCAQGLLADRPATDDQMQAVQPSSAGRRGPLPVLLQAPNVRAEAELVAERIAQALADGRAPDEVAVLFRTRQRMVLVAAALQRRGIAVQSMATPGFRAFVWKRPSVRLMTLHSSKGLEFPLVVIAGLDALPWKGEPLDEELRLLYVGMTRATHELVLSAAGTSPMVQRVHNSLEAVALQFAEQEAHV